MIQNSTCEEGYMYGEDNITSSIKLNQLILLCHFWCLHNNMNHFVI